MPSQEYAPGRSVDLVGNMTDPTVLLWHGMQADSRAAVGPLADMLAAHGVGVVVPDWDSHAADGGRSDLLRSVDFACGFDGATGGLTLVGWSMGGVAAAGLTVRAPTLGVTLIHTVCLAGAFMARDPISGGTVAGVPAAHEVGTAFTLLHGLHDDVVPLTASRDFADSLDRAGWPVDIVELDADHGSIAGASYDAAADRYLPATDAATLDVAASVAERIAATVRR